jgi:hypothetical protein
MRGASSVHVKLTSDIANTSEAIRIDVCFSFDSFSRKIRHSAIFDFGNNIGTKLPTEECRFEVRFQTLIGPAVDPTEMS